MFAFNFKDALEARKLSFIARIITKYSLERFLSICGDKIHRYDDIIMEFYGKARFAG